jgi:hypothetical protein
VEQDRARNGRPITSFGERAKALRRNIQVAFARGRLVAAARGVNVKAIAERCSSLPKLDVIALARSPQEGSPDCIRRAFDAGTSPLVAVCDPSTVWEEDAALWVALAFARQPQAKALFADHAEDGIAIHKPDFSWAYLLARDFVAPVVVYDRRLLAAAMDAVGRMERQPLTMAAAAYAIALEALHGLAADEILHVRHPLWHTAAGAAAGESQVGKADVAREALRHRGIEARVSSRSDDPAIHDIVFARTRSPKVSIVIPTKNAGELVEKCIADLRATAAYEPYEIVVIDHESDEPRLCEYLASESAAGRLKVFSYRGPFNYAAMNNAAIKQCDGELVLLLNNDVDGFSPAWLDQMVATQELDQRIAAVGALLQYPDGAIQHAGVILTPNAALHRGPRRAASRCAGLPGPHSVAAGVLGGDGGVHARAAIGVRGGRRFRRGVSRRLQRHRSLFAAAAGGIQDRLQPAGAGEPLGEPVTAAQGDGQRKVSRPLAGVFPTRSLL